MTYQSELGIPRRSSYKAGARLQLSPALASAPRRAKTNVVLITATIEVRDVERLSRVLAHIARLPSV